MRERDRLRLDLIGFFNTAPSALTVSGSRCVSGQKLNGDVRYWYCEIEDGGRGRGDDTAGWDYCCRPGNECGYSEGYEYPW
jgi:hypothetical protein